MKKEFDRATKVLIAIAVCAFLFFFGGIVCFLFASNFGFDTDVATKFKFSQEEYTALEKELHITFPNGTNIISATYYATLRGDYATVTFDVPIRENFEATLNGYKSMNRMGITATVIEQEEEKSYAVQALYEYSFHQSSSIDHVKFLLYKLEKTDSWIRYQLQIENPSQTLYSILCKSKGSK